MAELFRIGIVGAGSVSDGYHAPVLAQFPGVRLEWVCDADLGKAKSFAKRHGIPAFGAGLDALSEVDAVLVAIPVGLRAKTLETAFRRGWHAFVEKPFASSLKEHDAILSASRAAGVQVGVGLMRRFYRPTLIARDILRRNAFGPLKEVWAAEGAPMRGSGRGADWYQNDPAAAGGGVLIETGSHLVDQALFMADAVSFHDVRARLAVVEGLDLDSRVGMRVLRRGQADAFEFRLFLSRLSEVCAGIHLVFQKATVRVGLGSDGPVDLVDAEFRKLCRLDVPIRSASGVYQAFFLEWEGFIEQCRSGVSSEVDASTVRLGTGIIEEAYATRRREALK